MMMRGWALAAAAMAIHAPDFVMPEIVFTGTATAPRRKSPGTRARRAWKRRRASGRR